MKFRIRLSVSIPKTRWTLQPFENVFISATYFRNFFRKGAPKYAIFHKRIFFSGCTIILKYIENKKGSRGSGGMLSWKIFENLPTVVAILALFEQFLGKFRYFLLLNVSVSPNVMDFVRTFSIMRA